MALRSIVCLHNGFDFEESSLATAVALAKQNGADLRIVHAVMITQPYAGAYAEAAIVGTGWQEAVNAQMEQQERAARESAAAICQKHGLPLSDLADAPLPRATFQVIEAPTAKPLARMLGVSDVIVVGAAKGSGHVVDDGVIDLALFSTARPLLIVRPQPDGAPAPILGAPAGLAWSGSPEAVHATVHWRDVYAGASKVHVFVATGGGEASSPEDQALVLGYLKAHGANAELETVERDGKSAAHAILERARAAGCAYLVMGAYGHSAFREMLFGGFSETMLEEAEMPLLLCH